MSIELVAFSQHAGAVATIAAKIVRTYQETRNVLRKDADALRFQTQQALVMARAQALGGLARENIVQIARTQDLIDRYKSSNLLDGYAYAAAIDQLRILSHELAENLEDLRWRIP